MTLSILYPSARSDSRPQSAKSAFVYHKAENDPIVVPAQGRYSPHPTLIIDHQWLLYIDWLRTSPAPSTTQPQAASLAPRSMESDNTPHEHQADADRSPGIEPIAIIGLACRLSGGVKNELDLWELCARGRHGWTPIPKDRFSAEAYVHPNIDKNGCVSLYASLPC